MDDPRIEFKDPCVVEDCEQPAFGKLVVCPEHRITHCYACGKDMGVEKILSQKCGSCIRKIHRQVTGR